MINSAIGRVVKESVKGLTGVGGKNLTKPKSKFKYVPFRGSSDRLSISKNVEKIYQDNGTIFWTAENEEDVPRWSHYYDKEKDQMIMNWYGNTVTRIGNEVTDSEQVQRLTKYPNLSPSSNIKDKSDKTIKPLKNVYANQTQGQHDAFKSDMEAAMQRNGMNSVGMINDTKRKEIIDAYAQDKTENVKPFLTKGRGDKQSKYEDNASKRYEDRYKNNPKYLPKKKIPDYTSGPSIKYDEYNSLYTLDENTADLKTEFQTWKNWDFIPFTLHDIVNRKYLPFRSYINSISDQSDAEWNQIRYIGRADNVQIYNGFSRIVSLDFTTVCFSVKELHPMWQRINYLVGLTKPAGYTTDDPLLASPQNSNFIIPPFLKLNLGDMYKEQPVVMTSVALTIPPEASWELTSDVENMDNNYEYLNGTFTTEKDQNILVGHYPNMAQLSISFNFLEKRLPKTTNRHFGHYKSEDEPLNEYIFDDEGNPELGFNYNLIHPDPANTIRKEAEAEEGTDIGQDPDPNSTDPDPFQGFDSPGCTTYPPSKYYRSSSTGNLKTKEESRVASELETWKDCACQETAKMMNEQKRVRGQDAKNTCQWDKDGKCIETVNGKKVPDGLKCVYTTEFNEEPEEEEDEDQPPKCPYPIGGENEKDEDGRLIGFTPSEKELVDKKEPAVISKLKKRNLAYWIKDVADFIAHKIGKGKIGNGPYTYQDSDSKDNPPLSKIRKVYSRNDAILIEFDDNGNPISYSGQKVPDDIKTDFKIDCDKDDIQEIREIAGNYQPVIYVDVNQPFKIRLDTTGTNAITNSNYNNIGEVKTLLADFVSKRMNDSFSADGNVGSRGIKKYGDLSRKEHKGTVIEKDELYYIPYEEDRDKMIKGHKVYPGTADYVNYEVNNDVADQLKLGDGKKYAELKFGFYAIVSKTKRKISSSPADQNIENEIGDHIFDFLWGLNGETFSGGRVSEVPGAGGDGTEMNTDQKKAVKLGRGGTRLREIEIERLEKKLVSESSIDARIKDPNTTVFDYEPIGQWNEEQTSLIVSRMANPDYQQIISKKYNNNASRIQIENYLVILEGTTDQDAKDADVKYMEQSYAKLNVDVDETKQNETNPEYLKSTIEQYKAELKSFQDVIEKDDEKSLPVGFYFDKKSSHPNHFVPWVKDHALDKIEFIDDGSASNEEPEKVDVPEPKPKTDTPTSNRTPVWTWNPIENADTYEIEFKGKTTVTKNVSYQYKDEDGNPIKILGKHTIRVKAGVPNKAGTGLDWSTAGIHEVQVDKKALPPKPSKCPYKVGEEGEKDINGRLVGFEVADPSSADTANQVNQGIIKAIENNVKMWSGDVMAYIIANEDMGELTYPCDPSKVSWASDGTYVTTIYEQNQMKWMVSSKTITTLGMNGETAGFPLQLNGKDLGSTYYQDFDMTCGPNEEGSSRGDESKDDPNEPLKTPNPHTQSPTNNSKPVWKWLEIKGANKYKVTLERVVLHHRSGWRQAEDYGTIQYSDKLEAKPLLSLDDGFYRIGVTAEETEKTFAGGRTESVVKRSSEVGTHIAEIKDGAPTTPTPKPTEGCDDYPKPYELFLSSSEWCAINQPRISFSRKLKVKTQWKKEVGLYLACKQGIDVSTLQYNYTVFNDDGRIVKVIFDGKEIIVENDEENTFFLNKGTALEGDELEAYINMQYIPDWNPNDSYKGKRVTDPKLKNCPGEQGFIPNKVFHNGILYIAQTSTSGTVPPGHRPDDVNDRTLPDNLMASQQRDLETYENDLKEKYYKRWWLTEKENALLNSAEEDF